MRHAARELGFRATVRVGETNFGWLGGLGVDATAEGRVLMRVVSQGEGYRVGNFDEALVDLVKPVAREAGRKKKTPRVRGVAASWRGAG